MSNTFCVSADDSSLEPINLLSFVFFILLVHIFSCTALFRRAFLSCICADDFNIGPISMPLLHSSSKTSRLNSSKTSQKVTAHTDEVRGCLAKNCNEKR
jgi:hypothetical protein